MNEESVQWDMAVFADLGTEPPQMMPSYNNRFIVRMFRSGESLELEFHDNGVGKIIERSLDGGDVRAHASYKALLASERFGNLRQWADSQRILLKDVHEEPERRLRVWGRMPGSNERISAEELDDFLANRKVGSESVEIMLIDGPAGIGKTRFIEDLASLRAREFVTRQRPLILHVESRGRVLTFIQDLIAFSLQRMRLSATFDQVPILVRHGLVTLAIDGFDELGDPSGYEHAWGQLNNLIHQVRGGGTVILAGRDTFVGPERIRRDIKSLKCRDVVKALTLQPPTPHDAKDWLRRHGWQEDDVSSVDELFEPGSYALRPFFLAQLANPGIATTIRDEAAGTPLPFLVDLMISREVGKFGAAVDEVMNSTQRHGLVRHFLREVARFMADDQTEAVDEVALAWLVDIAVELAVPEGIGPETLRLLKNRASVMAFLAKDDARNHRRFAHSQLFNHFLGEETLDTVAKREVPKYLRRNILASDFLTAFGDLVTHVVHGDDAQRILTFFEAGLELIQSYTSMDRGPRNLGALLVTMLPAMAYSDRRLELGPLDVDEALMNDATAPTAIFNGLFVSQLDLRGADVRALIFKDSVVVTLIADEATRLCRSFPIPNLIRYETHGGHQTIVSPAAIEDWIAERVDDPVSGADQGHLDRVLEDHPLVKLLDRVCRNRSYWIRLDENDAIAARLIGDPNWTTLIALLRQHELIREERKPAGGQSALFLHIKKPMDILRKVPGDEQIRQFYQSLEETIAT